jgi:hypothetical protein
MRERDDRDFNDRGFAWYYRFTPCKTELRRMYRFGADECDIEVMSA